MTQANDVLERDGLVNSCVVIAFESDEFGVDAV